MASHNSSNPLYNGTTSHYGADNVIKMIAVIDSRPPLIVNAPRIIGGIRLKHFKDFTSLHNDCYKFYFQSQDSEFGTVKEELVDDEAIVPIDDGKIMAWVISNISLAKSMSSLQANHQLSQPPLLKTESGFDPATELPDPIVEPEQLLGSLYHPVPVINFHRSHRASRSLPRSLTPRSLYANFEQLNSSGDIMGCQQDSRSDYEPISPLSFRSNLYDTPLHHKRDTMQTIYLSLKADRTNLGVRNREWLKFVIENAFLGSSLVNWLTKNVCGFCNRGDAKRYANEMLVKGLIRSPIPKAGFSERCFYTLT